MLLWKKYSNTKGKLAKGNAILPIRMKTGRELANTPQVHVVKELSGWLDYMQNRREIVVNGFKEDLKPL